MAGPVSLRALHDFDRAQAAAAVGDRHGCEKWLNDAFDVLGWDRPFPRAGIPRAFFDETSIPYGRAG